MAKSELFTQLADINFAGKDPDTITEEVISRYELLTGRSLARSDPVRLFLNAIILELIQQRNAIDFAAKMNLLAYAEGEYLDHIGELLGVTRLEASSAVCRVKFTLPADHDSAIMLPKGTRVSPDGEIIFATTDNLTLPEGVNEGVITAQCTETGEKGNGYIPGQIARMVDVFSFAAECVNVTESTGGTERESDEAFRERIHIVPESFSTAGSKKGYEYYALSADSSIASVSVITPPETQPGYVDIYVLLTGGVLPDDDMLERVRLFCSGDSVRPDTDFVRVLRPEVVPCNVNLNYWVSQKNATQLDAIKEAVDQAVGEWVAWQCSAIGRDINPSLLISKIILAGAKRCEIIQPIFAALSHRQVASIYTIDIHYQGLEDD